MQTKGKAFLLGAGISFILMLGTQVFLGSRHPETVEKNHNMSERQLILAFEYPDKMQFSGELVPVHEPDVHERLDKEIQVNAYWQSNTLLLIKRSHRWKNQIVKILKEEGLPEDFYFLAVAESGLSNLVSGKGAKGFWQFIPETAKQYGLTVNENIDERMDAEKATRAACKYLKESYSRFGSWTMAAAAYNMGNGGISSAIRVQQAGNYYDLYLNQETSRYVFRILALKLILSDPEAFGFKVFQRDLYKSYRTRKIEVKTSIPDLASFAAAHNCNYKTLKILNPWLLQNKLTIEGGRVFELLLPESTIDAEPSERFQPDTLQPFPENYSDQKEEPYRKPDSFK